MPPKTRQRPEAKSFRWQAQVWEEEDRYDKKVDITILAHERRFIDQCFSEERTRPWSTRLADYWAHYGAKPCPLVGAFRRNKPLPDGRKPGTLYQKFDAVGLAFILHRCRSARIGSHFHGFMHLPRELRDLVYSYALVTDSRFVVTDSRENIDDFGTMFEDHEGEYYHRYQDDDENRPLRGRGPSLMFVNCDSTHRLGRMNLLMGVSRTIQAEAAKVFFSRNQLIISAGKLRHPPGFNNIRPTYKSSIFYSSLARDVSYSFDMRDHPMADMDNLNHGNLIDKSAIDQGELPPGEALRLLHDQKTMELELAWVDRIDAIKSMTLDRLQLSFEECYCSIGCCRKVGWILDALIYKDMPPGITQDDVYCNEDWKTRPPLVIEVIGWRSGKEKAMIMEKLGRLEGPQPVDIRLLEDRFGRW